MLSLPSCSDGAGGPPPCANDAECQPVCEADCAPEQVVSAECSEFLLACVCDCGRNGAGGQGGHGGAGGGECPASMLRQELVPTEIPCDPAMGVPPCDTECPSQCLEGGFELGSRGAACVSTPSTGSFCDCLCVSCEPQ